jgi:hypothetical protein
VFGILRRLFYRPVIRLGSLGYNRRGGQRLRSEGFASYLAANNRRSLNTDRQDALLATRRFARQMLVVAALGLVTWFVVESAQAIGVF